MTDKKRVALVILDGWGESGDEQFNAIAKAQTPNWNWLKKHALTSQLKASGRQVGLPDGQMGNSEVGHMHIGAGRVVNQDLTRISLACQRQELGRLPPLSQAIQAAKKRQSAIHILGLLSEGGVHSHQDHLFALLETLNAQGVKQVFVHLILDGRDTPPKSALASIAQLELLLKKHQMGKIASLAGRFYAMDRDKRWERVERAYQTLCNGSKTTLSAVDAVNQAYNEALTDEFIKPTALKDYQAIEQDSLVINFNFRSDRMRELSQALTETHFEGFDRKHAPTIHYLTFTEYHPELKAEILFPPQDIKNTLGEILSAHQLAQFRIAETEKYAHVTFFFNGGQDEPFPLETRQLIPSPKVKTYDLKPEMSAYAVSEALCSAISKKSYSFLLCNFANADMVGHTGNFEATVKAIEAVDDCLGDVIKACKETQTDLLITADHGNAESMFDETTGQPHTAHTKNLVPFIYLGQAATLAKDDASLQDISPTVLTLLELDKPAELCGQSIILRARHEPSN